MPKRQDIKSILIIGAGPIVIGQGSEFDYAGVQACQALKEEGYRVILINSNPATIMTDPNLCDATYIEPMTVDCIERIIQQEKPDALLPTMGGQTALNCTLELYNKGILEKNQVDIIGASIEAIEKAENRAAFKKVMESHGLEVPRSEIAHSISEAHAIFTKLKLEYPVIIRPSYTLGGSGSGIAYDENEFLAICERGLNLSPVHSLLIEESLLGWKEFEMEVVRDKKDNCIIVCCIENMDPMGVHTGDSITVAPQQTLRDKEYQNMRNAAIVVLRAIGVETGGSNVQFAVHPNTGRMLVIEMNPRVSRSSALASKATGFPIAKVAAKLAVGFTLDELTNDITGGIIPASFEPVLDYVVTKIPRFDFDKFKGATHTLTTQMKAVGEVMGLGRTFQESLQKAIVSLELGVNGLASKINLNPINPLTAKTSLFEKMKAKMQEKLKIPTADRIFDIADSLRIGLDVNSIAEASLIDPWFIAQIEDLVFTEKRIAETSFQTLTKEKLMDYKRRGFSDSRIAELLGVNENDVRELRHAFEVLPVFKRVDSVAAEFPCSTAYLYSTYETFCEAEFKNTKKIIILGSGPIRIGQGIEFDCCSVHAILALREEGFQTIMINCNPETVSTDFNIADKLYFEPITLEHVLEIIHKEKPLGVVLHFGGQTPLKLVKSLEALQIPILGTKAFAIDCAEDRLRFQQLIENLDLHHSQCKIVKSIEDAMAASQTLGFPLIVRPSYVLGGQMMRIVHDIHQLQHYFEDIFSFSNKNLSNSNSNQISILIDQFLTNAIEVDVDAISDGQTVFIGGILEHVEPAGIHSGDSTSSIPPFSLSKKIIESIQIQVEKIALALDIIGPFNIQFAIQNEIIYVLEVNPRVSRTTPFVSQAIGISLAKAAMRCMIGKTLKEQGLINTIVPPYFSIKKPIFPFEKFIGADKTLGPEMKSTGEAMGMGKTFLEALQKANNDYAFSQHEKVDSIQKRHQQIIRTKNKTHPEFTS